jgi:transcriptional regulator with XRE-family HTH domain
VDDNRNCITKLLDVFRTQTEIADFCGVNRSAVSHWKRDNHIPRWHLHALSKHTGISIDELVGGDEE